MSNAIRFVPPRVALTDPRTGMITREWYLFWQDMFNRAGGPDGMGSTDLAASLFEDAGSSETNAVLFSLEQSFGQDPPPQAQQVSTLDSIVAELSGLQDRIAELVKELDSIKQGTTI